MTLFSQQDSQVIHSIKKYVEEVRGERSGESRVSFLCYEARSVIGLNEIHVDVMLNKEAPEEATGVRCTSNQSMEWSGLLLRITMEARYHDLDKTTFLHLLH